MNIIDGKDQDDFAKILTDAKSTRSLEALTIALETAYVLGKRRGFDDCAAMTRRLMSGETADSILAEEKAAKT